MMDNIFKVALLQIKPYGAGREANFGIGEKYCRLAAEKGADLALFPELWSIGFTSCPGGRKGEEKWKSLALERNGKWYGEFKDLARELDMAIAVTYLEKWDGLPRNTVSVIDRHGNTVLTYGKVHTCDFDCDRMCTPGDEFVVCDLDTGKDNVKIGTMICYDREFPESARVLMLKGAEIILTPNACNLGEGRLGQFRTRAFENMTGVALANYPAPICNGRSCAYDAVSFEEIDGDPVDTEIVMAGPEEGIYFAPFDMGGIRAYRKRESWGNAYRKPGTYGILTSERVERPFVREDARR